MTSQKPPFYWTAPILAACLSATMFSSFIQLKPHSYESGLPVFFTLLPLAFYFAARTQVKSQKQIHALQARIEQLEAQATPSDSPLR